MHGRKRGSIRAKIVLPFFVLLAFLGMAGTVLITSRATTATVANFEGQLLRASLLSNDHLAVLEAERLAQLRAAIDTQGVPIDVANHDAAAFNRLLGPIQANALPAQLTIRALDQKGSEILSLTPAGQQASLTPIGGEPVVAGVLAGQSDAKGDKKVFSRRYGGGPDSRHPGSPHSGGQDRERKLQTEERP